MQYSIKKNESDLKKITKTLANIASEVVGFFNIKELLDKVIETTMKTLDAEVCSIFLEDKEEKEKIIKCVAGSGYAKELVGIAEYKIGEGFTGIVAETGEDFNIKSLEELQKCASKNEWIGKYDEYQWTDRKSGFRNGIALPLKIKDQILGVIKVENKKSGDFFTDEDVRIFKTIANIIALTIENAKLHEQNKNQLKTIAAKAAHRIHNQITRYDGIIYNLRNEIDRTDLNKQNLAEIKKKIEETTINLKRMVNEFQEYSKPIKLRKGLTDINKIIQSEEESVHLHNEIHIKFRQGENIPKINLDSGRFSENIRELLNNAIRVMQETKEGSNINITTKLIKSEDSGTKQAVSITIKDDGPGFPANFPVFSPFHTTNPQGTGLGLVTVKEIIEAHGGTINLIPGQEKGACFEIVIPVE